MFNKKIIIEENAIRKLDEVTEKFSKILVVTTKEIYNIFSSSIDRLINNTKCEIYYLNDNSIKEASSISCYLIVNYFDCIISIGGGTVNDTCKLAAKYSDITLVSVPTIISNDGVCSNVAVLKFENNNTDGLPAKAPDIIIIDTEIIKKSPVQYLKAGICDILSNYIALYDWDLAVKNNKEERNDIAKMISYVAFSTIFNLQSKIDNKSDEHIKLICQSLILSGLAMEVKGNTRPCSGSEHLFNHAINKYHKEVNVLHGYLVGLGALVSAILQKQDFESIVAYLKKNEIDVRPSTLGITKEVFVDSWLKAPLTRKNRYTILNEISLTKEKIIEIYDKIESEAY